MAFKLLIHSNHADGSTVFTDSSPDARTITRYGDTQHDTAQAKFGASSLYFDGTGDYLTAGNISIGTGNYTVDFWVRPAAVASVNDGLIQIGNSSFFSIYIYNGVLCVRTNNSAPTYGIVSSAISADVWTHIAVVRSGTSLYLFVNGVLVDTDTSSLDIPAGTIYIGYYYSASYTAYGHMDEIAIRDEAVWTANFTPPTAPYETAAAGGKPLIYGGKRPPQFGGLLMR